MGWKKGKGRNIRGREKTKVEKEKKERKMIYKKKIYVVKGSACRPTWRVAGG